MPDKKFNYFASGRRGFVNGLKHGEFFERPCLTAERESANPAFFGYGRRWERMGQHDEQEKKETNAPGGWIIHGLSFQALDRRVNGKR